MFLAVILIIIALIYSINHRSVPLRTAYAGVSLLVTAIMLFTSFFILMQIGIYALEPVALVFFESTLALIPAGTIMTLAGMVIHYFKSK